MHACMDLHTHTHTHRASSKDSCGAAILNMPRLSQTNGRKATTTSGWHLQRYRCWGAWDTTCGHKVHHKLPAWTGWSTFRPSPEVRYYLITFHFQSTKRVNSAQQARDTITVTCNAYGDSIWHASKYRVHELHRRLVSWCFEPSQPQRMTSGLLH